MEKTSTIYVVYYGEQYEPSIDMCAYVNKQDAVNAALLMQKELEDDQYGAYLIRELMLHHRVENE